MDIRKHMREETWMPGTKIRESINNQITEELSGSVGPNPSSGPGSSLTTSSLSPSSVSSALIHYLGDR